MRGAGFFGAARVMTESMELKQLRYFLAVLDLGSINRAAARLNISQPTLSQSIRALERSVGAELLVRTGGGVRATRIGETFANHAQTITREAEKAADEVAAMRGLGAGRISLGLNSALARYLAPPAISDFLGRSTGAQLDISVFSFGFSDIVGRLQRSDWDMVVTLSARETDYPPDIEVKRIRAVESRVYCGIEHPLARQPSVSLADMGRYEWIISNLGLAEQVLASAFASESQTPTIRIRTDSMELIPHVASTHPFLCVLPVESAFHAVAAGRLVEVRQEVIRSESEIVLLYSNMVSRTAALRQLMMSFAVFAGQACYPATVV